MAKHRIIKPIPPDFRTFPVRRTRQYLLRQNREFISEQDCEPLTIHHAIRAFKPASAWLRYILRSLLYRYKGSHYFGQIGNLLPMHHSALLNFNVTHPLPHIGSISSSVIANTMVSLDIELSFVDLRNLILGTCYSISSASQLQGWFLSADSVLVWLYAIVQDYSVCGELLYNHEGLR